MFSSFPPVGRQDEMSAKQKSQAPGQILNLYQENFFETAFPLQTDSLLLELRTPKEGTETSSTL